MRLDYRGPFPRDMENYLAFNGWHFNKGMCCWAVSRMYKKNNGQKVYIQPYTKEKLEQVFKNANIQMPITYDAVYIANMCLADFYGSSIKDELHLALFVKDVIEDEDAYEGMPFTRFYADCIGSGTSIPWEDVL